MSKNRDDRSKVGQSSVFSEQTNSKLEWMYKNSADLLNREEYLLGRAIDKNFEQLNEEENTNKQNSLVGVTIPKNHVEHECIPFSIRSYRSNENDEQVDIQRKIIEDPLMAIRQKEMESRRKILENPVKLKELHRLLKKEGEEKKKSERNLKKGKNKDKKHKKKKKRKNRSSSSSDDEDLDSLLARKYRQIREELGPNDGTFSKINLKKLLNAKDHRSSKDELKQKDSDHRKAGKRKSSDSASDSDYQSKKEGSKSRKYDLHDRSSKSDVNSYRNKNRSNSQDRYRDRRDGKSNLNDYKQSQASHLKQKTSRKSESYIESSSSSSDGDNEKAKRKNYGLVTAAGKKIELKYSSSKSSTSNHREEIRKTAPLPIKTYRKEKLTEEEKDRRCREMVENAAWRDTERKQKIDKYREECEREKREAKHYDKSFINKEIHKAIKNQTSVESRLKANINNIQRSGQAMESNFARR